MKILFLFFGTVAFSFGQVFSVNVSTPEELDLYVTVLNAISTIFFGSSGTFYTSLLNLGVLIGTFVAFSTFLLQGSSKSLLSVFKYTITAASILIVLFGPSATVSVNTNTIPTLCSASTSNSVMVPVNNVPWAIGFTFSLTNRIGGGLTELSKVMYANLTPFTDSSGGFSMDKSNGFIGAIKQEIKLLSLTTIEQTDYNKKLYPEIKASDQLPKEFFSQCIFTPFSSKGWSGLNEIYKIKHSSNIFQELDRLFRDPETGGNANISIGGIHPRKFMINTGGEVFKCGDVYDSLMKPTIEAYKDTFFCSFPDLNYAVLQLITGTATPPESNLRDIALQSALIGNMQSSAEQLGSGIENAGYVISNSKVEFAQSEMSKGLFQASILPDIKSTLSILLLAMAPFVLLVTFFMGAFKIIGEFAKAIIWIELWLPISSILNMIIVSSLSSRNQDTFSGDSGMNSINTLQYLSDATVIAGTAGYLYSMVPALAWLIVNGTADMLGTIGSGMTSALSVNMKTSEFNKDRALSAETESSGISSSAEMLQVQAIKEGSVSGRVLSSESNAGIEEIGDAAAMEVSTSVAKFEMTTDISEHSAEATGADIGSSNGITSGATANAGSTFTGSDGGPTSTVKAAANIQEEEQKGEVSGQAQADSELSSADFQGDTHVELSKIKQNSVVDSNTDIMKDAATGGAGTDLQQLAQKNELTELAGGLDGQKKLGKALAHPEFRDKKTNIATDAALTAGGVTPEDVGGSNAMNIAAQVGQTEADKDMNKLVNKESGEQEKQREISKREQPENETKGEYKERLKNEEQEVKDAGIKKMNSYGDIDGQRASNYDQTLARGITVATTIDSPLSGELTSITSSTFVASDNGISQVTSSGEIKGENYNADAYVNTQIHSEYQNNLGAPEKLLFETLDNFEDSRDWLVLDGQNFSLDHTMNDSEINSFMQSSAILTQSFKTGSMLLALSAPALLAMAKVKKEIRQKRLSNVRRDIKDINTHIDADTDRKNLENRSIDDKIKTTDSKIQESKFNTFESKRTLDNLNSKEKVLKDLIKNNKLSGLELQVAQKELKELNDNKKTFFKNIEDEKKVLKDQYDKKNKDIKLKKSLLEDIELNDQLKSDLSDNSKNMIKNKKSINSIRQGLNETILDSKLNIEKVNGMSFNKNLKDSIVNNSKEVLAMVKTSPNKAVSVLKGATLLVATYEAGKDVLVRTLKKSNTATGYSIVAGIDTAEDFAMGIFDTVIDTVQGGYFAVTGDVANFEKNRQEILDNVDKVIESGKSFVDTVDYEFSHERNNRATSVMDWLSSGQEGAIETAQSIYDWSVDNISSDLISTNSYNESLKRLNKD